MNSKILISGLFVLAVLVVSGCAQYGGNTQTPPPQNQPGATTASVSISNFAFSPATLTIAKGTTVTWTNNDSTAHTVTADDGSFDSGSLSTGQTFSKTFNSSGTFSYHCAIHPMMVAKIIVQ